MTWKSLASETYPSGTSILSYCLKINDLRNCAPAPVEKRVFFAVVGGECQLMYIPKCNVAEIAFDFCIYINTHGVRGVPTYVYT